MRGIGQRVDHRLLRLHFPERHCWPWHEHAWLGDDAMHRRSISVSSGSSWRLQAWLSHIPSIAVSPAPMGVHCILPLFCHSESCTCDPKGNPMLKQNIQQNSSLSAPMSKFPVDDFSCGKIVRTSGSGGSSHPQGRPQGCHQWW